MNNDQLFSQLSSIASSNTAKSQEFAREEMRFNAAEAEKNRNWQAQQSSSAHQREVLDLQKAGLNPVLSAGGSGAQVGSGATAQGSKGDVDKSVVPALTSIIVNQQNNATQQAIASMQAGAQLEAARLHASSSLQAANIAASASRFNATSSATAAYNSALLNSQAYRYGANKSYAGTKYASNKSYNASKYNTDSYAKTARRGQNMQLIGSLTNSAADVASSALRLRGMSR